MAKFQPFAGIRQKIQDMKENRRLRRETQGYDDYGDPVSFDPSMQDTVDPNSDLYGQEYMQEENRRRGELGLNPRMFLEGNQMDIPNPNYGQLEGGEMTDIDPRMLGGEGERPGLMDTVLKYGRMHPLYRAGRMMQHHPIYRGGRNLYDRWNEEPEMPENLEEY